MNYYRIYGFYFVSDTIFSQLNKGKAEQVELNVLLQSAPPLSSPYQSANAHVLNDGEYSISHLDNEIILDLRDYGVFFISKANESIIFRSYQSDIDLDEIKQIFLGIVLILYQMLHQRFALHASAITNELGAVLLMGKSGIGKSTLTATSLTRGYSIVSEDTSYIRIDNSEELSVIPSLPIVKLLEDAHKRMKNSMDSFSIHQFVWNKFHFDINDYFTDRPTPINAIFLIKPTDGEELEITKLDEFASLSALLRNTCRGHLIPLLRLEQPHFLFCSKIVQKIPVYQISRPQQGFYAAEILRRIPDFITHDFVNADS